MAQSIKKNFVYNLINVVSGLLFPLITFPYASRILFADGIGQVQFYQSIINYVILLTSLGIPLYGIKEVARVRDNKEELSKTTVEIISLNLLLCIIGYVIIALLCCTVGKIQDNLPLFLILSLSIFLNAIGCPWFYSGIEDFKYITVLGLIVRVFCVVFLFCAVRSRDDLLLYGVYAVIGSIGNNVINFLRLRKYINLKGIGFKLNNIWRHIKPAAAIFIFNIVTSIYINLDTVMLGFLSNTTAVGYYTGATKISHILITLVVSLGTVLLPRSSNLIKNGKVEEFYSLSNKSYNFITLLAFPMLWGVVILAPSIIMLFCGSSFIPSILTLRIIAPIIVFLGISNLLGIQMLYPLGKIKLLTISTCVGAIVNMTLNFILIPIWAENGAATATVAAEFSVAFVQIIMVKRMMPIKLFTRSTIIYLFSSIIMAGVCALLIPYFSGDFLKLICVTLVGSITYCFLLIVFKDDLSVSIKKQVTSKIHKNQ